MPLKLDQGVLSCHFNLKAIEETGLRASFMLLLSSPGTPCPLLYQKPMIQLVHYIGPLHLELCLQDSRAGPLPCSQSVSTEGKDGFKGQSIPVGPRC